MNADVFVEKLRDMSGEGYDDVEMIDLINQVIYNTNASHITGLNFKPLDSVCEIGLLWEHSISCLLKQSDREINALIVPGVIAEIKLIEEDYNANAAYTQKYEIKVQHYKANFGRVDMTGNTSADLVYDNMESIDNHQCSCDTNVHTTDHFHELKYVGVATNREYIKLNAQGKYKNHQTNNNAPSAIKHRNGDDIR